MGGTVSNLKKLFQTILPMAEFQYSPLLDPRQDNSGSPFLLEIRRNSPRTFARSREERSLPILVELTACLASSRHLIVCFPAILGHSHESDLSNLLNGGWPMINPF